MTADRPKNSCAACGLPRTDTARHFGYQLVACSACGLWSWTEGTSADYDLVYESAEYEAEQIKPFKAAENPEEFLRHPTYAPFFREVPITRGAALLDVGCGVGRFLAAARSIGWKCRGIDVSKKAVEIGQQARVWICLVRRSTSCVRRTFAFTRSPRLRCWSTCASQLN